MPSTTDIPVLPTIDTDGLPKPDVEAAPVKPDVEVAAAKPDVKVSKGMKGDKGARLLAIAPDDVPPAKNGRCRVALVVVLDDELATVRCQHVAVEGSGLCALHRIHLRVG